MWWGRPCLCLKQALRRNRNFLGKGGLRVGFSHTPVLSSAAASAAKRDLFEGGYKLWLYINV